MPTGLRLEMLIPEKTANFHRAIEISCLKQEIDEFALKVTYSLPTRLPMEVVPVTVLLKAAMVAERSDLAEQPR